MLSIFRLPFIWNIIYNNAKNSPPNATRYATYIHSNGSGFKKLNNGNLHSVGSPHLMSAYDKPRSWGRSITISRPKDQTKVTDFGVVQRLTYVFAASQILIQ